MDIATAITALTALSQQTRLEAYRLLVNTGSKGMASGEIAERLGVVQNTMSAHLASLKQAGLIHSERESRVIRYFADFHTMRVLLGFLVEDCCGGRPQLCSPLLDEIMPQEKSQDKDNNHNA